MHSERDHWASGSRPTRLMSYVHTEEFECLRNGWTGWRRA
jgi:hypothetical protein